MRTSMGEADAFWRELLAGRWSVIDRFDARGPCLVVVRCRDARPPRRLTQREQDVIVLAAGGESNKVIAYELGLTVGSVSSYLAAAMRKLGVVSRAELVAIARAAAREGDT
jgi:DNA-binding NarL/FixJ family response regulator